MKRYGVYGFSGGIDEVISNIEDKSIWQYETLADVLDDFESRKTKKKYHPWPWYDFFIKFYAFDGRINRPVYLLCCHQKGRKTPIGFKFIIERKDDE